MVADTLGDHLQGDIGRLRDELLARIDGPEVVGCGLMRLPWPCRTVEERVVEPIRHLRACQSREIGLVSHKQSGPGAQGWARWATLVNGRNVNGSRATPSGSGRGRTRGVVASRPGGRGGEVHWPANNWADVAGSSAADQSLLRRTAKQ